MRREERRRRNEEVMLAGPITEGSYDGLERVSEVLG
jgi:hypothetical protein